MHRIFQTFIDLLSAAEDPVGFSDAMAATAAALDLSCFATMRSQTASTASVMATSTNWPTPVRDIRILDLSQMLAGPYGTMILADHGAKVIKIESLEGDMTRTAGGAGSPTGVDRRLQGYFQSVDRNKESVVLDLKTAGGREAFKRMVRDADAVTVKPVRIPN
jgi:hypothetical protein